MNGGFQREVNGARERLRCLEAMRQEKQVSIQEMWFGEQNPQEHPLGPPSDYDFMEVLEHSRLRVV